MPGSLNYSPSGSEGGRSLGGGGTDPIGIDLVATPGTTPLKWRGRTSTNSDRGGGGNVQEVANGRATDGKKIEKPQDRVPPRIATRKPSSETTTTAASLDERAGLGRRPSAFTDAVSRENDISNQPDDSSRDDRNPPSAVSTPSHTSPSASSNTEKVADCAEGAQEDECRDVALDDSLGATARSLAGHSVDDSQRSDRSKHAGYRTALPPPNNPSLENEEPGRVSNFREEQSPPPPGTTSEGHRGQDSAAPSASAPSGDPEPSNLPNASGGHSRDDRKSDSHESAQSTLPIPTAAVEIATALARKASFSRGEDTPLGESNHGDRQRRRTLTPSNAENDGRNEGAQLQVVPSVVRTGTSHDLRAAPLERGADNTADDSDGETHEAGGIAVGLASTNLGGDGRSETNGGTDDWFATRRPSTSQNNPKGSTGDDNLSKKSRSLAGMAAGAVLSQPDAIGQASEDALTMNSENNTGADTDPDSEQQHHRQSKEGRALQGHPNAIHSNDDEHGSVAANLATGADTRVSPQRRSSGRKKRNSTEDANNIATCTFVSEGAESQNPTVTGVESGTVDGERENGLVRLSTNRELLQSPPMISRRNSSAQRSEPLAGVDNMVKVTGARKPGKDSGAIPPSRTVEAVRPGYRGEQQKRSTTNRPPPLTPRRDRSPSTAAVGLSNPRSPRSPVAMAARVVSLEESARSTLRMKRAAEAIALEDAQIHARAERRNERWKEPPEHQANSRSPLIEPEEENDGNPDANHEQEHRARRAEKMRVRALRDIAARHEAEVERDRALELTLEVLRRKRADQRQGVGRVHSAPGRKDAHSPPRRSKRPADHRTSLARKIKDSAARSCGLSSAQVLLLRRSREVGRGGSRPRAGCERRIDELAQPRDNRPATRTRDAATEALLEELTKSMTHKERRAFVHACLADAKECTHRPHTRSLASQRAVGGRTIDGREGEEEAKDESGAARARDAFLYRVDAQERAKATAMEHRRGELAYKSVLDKRVCPGCGAEQSYDEVQEKRKTCPNCEVEYRKPRTWATVRKDFLNRMEAFQQSKWESLQAATDRSKRRNTTRVVGRSNHDDAAITEGDVDDQEHLDDQEHRFFWEDVEDDFVSRLQEDAARRQASLASRSAALHQNWTFQPTLSAASERVVGDSAWAGMSFMERVEEDLQRRRETLTAARDDLEDRSGYRFGGSYASDP